MSVTCGRSVIFSGYSGFLHQEYWPPLIEILLKVVLKQHNPTLAIVWVYISTFRILTDKHILRFLSLAIVWSQLSTWQNSDWQTLPWPSYRVQLSTWQNSDRHTLPWPSYWVQLSTWQNSDWQTLSWPSHRVQLSTWQNYGLTNPTLAIVSNLFWWWVPITQICDTCFN